MMSQMHTLSVLAILSVLLALAPCVHPATTPTETTQRARVWFAMLDTNSLTLWTECNRTHLSNNKHGAALWLVDRLRDHRWRVPVGDPRAEVVVVPALIDWFNRKECGARGWEQHLQNLMGVVLASGKDTQAKPHVLIAQDYRS